MSILKWQDNFSVGVPSIDHEHRELIELIAGFQNQIALRDSGKSNIDSLMTCLGDTLAQITAHFALEEKLMRDSGYDRYPEHKADHELLLDELRDIMDAVEQDSEIDQELLGKTLGDWFARHFQNEDARLHGKLG
jgi:hemerythrin-like metal-binding protein